MDFDVTFPVQNERFGVSVSSPHGIDAVMEYSVVVEHLSGSKDKVSYDSVAQEDGRYLCRAHIKARNGNCYRLEDIWTAREDTVFLERRFTCESVHAPADLRLFSDMDCTDKTAQNILDYQFVIPGALYNHNDTDFDGRDDYLGTYAQDYRDDRNPSLSVLCYSKKRKAFVSMMRTDPPKVDALLTREEIKARHFVHDTDVGSMGIAPSMHKPGSISLHFDFPYYERSSFCLNIDGSEWSAYRHMEPGDSIDIQYTLLFGAADDLTDASWKTTRYQMKAILHDEVPLPFSLEDARKYRREMIFNSFREFPDKRGTPAGFFIHFSPRSAYGRHNILEYGFAGAQTLNCYAMLCAHADNGNGEYRRRALKTLDFFVNRCIGESGLPNGIYDIDSEKFIYWWTGILFPFQYANDRKQLEAYLGKQVVTALSSVARELRNVEGNYSRTMTEAMNYLLLCYMKEKQAGIEHPEWLEAVKRFCDRMIEIQNPDGSWARAYTMDGKPLQKPEAWFGANTIERGSGVIFPSEVLLTLYGITGDARYCGSARQAAQFIVDHYVKDVLYVGGLNDTTHKKSIKIDAVGVMFAMRTMLMTYEATKEEAFLKGARDAARILGSWTYLWNIPFDRNTLLGRFGFATTGWAGCDVIPACSYVDNEFQEFVPDIIRIAGYCKERELAVLAKIVSRGMQHGMSMPNHDYGYAMMGVQCEGYMTALWLSDTAAGEFAGAACKNKGDDNDTCNGLINAQALYNMDYVQSRFGRLDYDRMIQCVMEDAAE